MENKFQENFTSGDDGNGASCDSSKSDEGSCSSKPHPSGPSHPLNQLDPDEIRRVVYLLKVHATSQEISGKLVFSSVSLLEPRKHEMLQYFGGVGPIPERRAWAVFSEDGVNACYESNVNLSRGVVETFVKLPAGTQPSFNTEDAANVQDFVRAEPRVIERAKKAGVTNMEYLICDPWSYGYNDTSLDKENRRLMDMYLYEQKFDGDNQYAHPLDFIVTVDMIAKKVLEIIDLPVCSENESLGSERPISSPPQCANYDPQVMLEFKYRSNVKPLEIRQPKGPSFSLVGNALSWQNWEMIIGFNFREGLTLHNVTIGDGDRRRSVLYRAALSEMAVPYGDPRPPFHRKCAFDLGEYGLGYSANSLTNGCDCLGEIQYMDAVFADSAGEPMITKNAVCIHEEDAGLLQKHTDEFKQVTIARARKLVISFIATVNNYDYAFYWNFLQDGTIQFEVKATGLLSTHNLGHDCTPGGFGVIMAPRINAPYHQHIFCARLDPMIDGQNNTVAIQDIFPLLEGSPENPFGQGFKTQVKVLEKAGGSNTNADLGRSWLVQNENICHPYAKCPVAWKLVAPGFSRIFAGPTSGVGRRAGFARHNVWVTPYKEDQLYAAGKYINQAPGGRDGVDVWAGENENVRNTDIVLWHTFGMNHIPRAEDYPLMTVEGVSFTLKPANFFDANPALDVPAPNRIN